MIFDYIYKACDDIESYFTETFNSKSVNIETINLQRTKAFKIQSFGRVLRRAFKKSDLKNKIFRDSAQNIKDSGKFIEDAIGDYLYHFEMKEFSESDLKLNKALNDLNENIKTFEKHLKSIRESFKKLEELNIRELYLKGCVREFKKIRGDIEAIDPNLLEDGTHELRRKLRWVIMHIIYPKGLFSYKEKNPDVNKYTELSPNKKFNPVKISFEAVNFLSVSVYRLGKIKDMGLSKNYNKDHSSINESDSKTIKVTQSIIVDEVKSKYIKKLIKEIKKEL